MDEKNKEGMDEIYEMIGNYSSFEDLLTKDNRNKESCENPVKKKRADVDLGKEENTGKNQWKSILPLKLTCTIVLTLIKRFLKVHFWRFVGNRTIRKVQKTCFNVSLFKRFLEKPAKIALSFATQAYLLLRWKNVLGENQISDLLAHLQ